MSDLTNGGNEERFEDLIANPFDWNNGTDLGPKNIDHLPPWALIVLQVVFYSLLAFILLYFVSHWIFHSWSYANVFSIGLTKRRKPGASWSDRWISALAVFMWILYTIYMVGFVFATVGMFQFARYYKSMLEIMPVRDANVISTVLWIYFGMSIFPMVINIVMALTKLTIDSIRNMRVRNDFKDRVNSFVNEYRDYCSFTQAAPTSTDPKHQAPVIPHSSAPLPGVEESHNLPMVTILLPVYNEPLPNLMGALNGLAASDYPRLKIYVGFDNYDVETTFFSLCRLLTGVPLKATLPRRRGAPMSPTSPITNEDLSETVDMRSDMGRKALKYNGFDQIVASGGASPSMRGYDPNSPRMSPAYATPIPPSPAGSFGGYGYDNEDMGLDFDAENCPDEYTLEYRGVRFSIFRFPHSGKLGTQRAMFEKLQAELAAESAETGAPEEKIAPMVLFMDSDTAIMPNTVSQMVSELQKSPKTKACTGFVVSRNQDSFNVWRIMQDAEYIESMIFRNAEAIMGAVTCLPGVLTMFRYHVLLDVAPDYFYQSEGINTTFDFCQRYLGEDRFMTHLLMEKPGTHTLGFSTAAVCKTEAPGDFYTLLRQRRRWFLGTISNEIVMLCTPQFWTKFPLLMLTKFFMILKVGGAITYLVLLELIFAAIFDSVKPEAFIWLMAIIVPNWLFVTVWAIKERRLKSVLIFPLYFWWNPFFTLVLLMYSFMTVRERTWGGPRAAAGNDADGHDDKKEDEGHGHEMDEVVADKPMYVRA